MFLLIRQAAPLDADIGRQVLAHDLFERLHRLSRTVTVRRLARDGRGIEHVEAADRTGPGRVVRRTEGRDGDHRTAVAPHMEEVEIALVRTVGRLGLNVDAVDTVEHVEVVDIDRTCEGFERREDIGHRHAQQLRLVAVDVVVELRNVALHRRRQPRQFGTPLSVIHQRVDGLLQVGIGAVAARFEHHLEAARSTQTRDDGGRT